MTLFIFIIIVVSCALSWMLTGLLRSYALRAGIVDMPNHRSSHAVPTPRGGGAGFAVVFGVGVLFLIGSSPESASLWAALLGGGVLIAGVGWLDDRRGLSSRTRFVVHVLASVWAVAWLKGLPHLEIGIGTLPLGVVGYALAIVGLAWSINLYNFMDGIDGLAGGQALIVGVAAGVHCALAGDWALAAVCWLLAGAVAGFMVWNFPPARIFMGDVGSGLLGYVFATLALAGENRSTLPLLTWALLLLPFIVDATATLLWRMHRGERLSEAHRAHAYQRAVQRGFSHMQVTLSILALDCVLAIISYIVRWRPVWLLPITLIAVAGLLLLWRCFSAVSHPGAASGRS